MKRLMQSKSMCGLILFLILGLVLIYFNKLNATSVDFIKWLAGSFYLSRGADNLTNIMLNKGDNNGNP